MAVTEITAAARRLKNMVGAGKPLQYPIKTIAVLELKKVPAMTLGGRLVRSRSTTLSSVSRLIPVSPEAAVAVVVQLLLHSLFNVLLCLGIDYTIKFEDPNLADADPKRVPRCDSGEE